MALMLGSIWCIKIKQVSKGIPAEEGHPTLGERRWLKGQLHGRYSLWKRRLEMRPLQSAQRFVNHCP